MKKKDVTDYIDNSKFDILSDFLGASKDITVKCKTHDKIFTTRVNNVFRGCEICKKEHHYKWDKDWRHIDQDEIIRRCKNIHPEYDYSKVNYVNATTLIDVICPKHGLFKITYANLTHKTKPQGCKQCGIEKRSKSRIVDREIYIENIQKQFPYDTLDFTKIRQDVNYNGVRYPVTFTCTKHGDFILDFNSAFWCRRTYLCEKCNKQNKKYSNFAKTVYIMLSSLNIEFDPEHRFPEWLIYKQPLLLDFYIPSLNLAIEVQGGQHFHYCSKYHKSIKDLQLLQYKDELKYNLCKEHNINLIYYAEESDIIDIKDSYYNTIFTNLDDLKNYILNLI